jgi:hypothetical protein
MHIDPVVVLIARLAIGALFLVGALQKLRSSGRFVRALADYRLLPAPLLLPAAWAVPALEAAIGVGALAQCALACRAGLVVLVVYGCAIAINLVRGRSGFDCGCSGDRLPASWALVARNATLAAVAWIALAPASPRALSPIVVVIVAGGVLACAIAYAGFNAVLAARARFEEYV